MRSVNGNDPRRRFVSRGRNTTFRQTPERKSNMIVFSDSDSYYSDSDHIQFINNTKKVHDAILLSDYSEESSNEDEKGNNHTQNNNPREIHSLKRPSHGTPQSVRRHLINSRRSSEKASPESQIPQEEEEEYVTAHKKACGNNHHVILPSNNNVNADEQNSQSTDSNENQNASSTENNAQQANLTQNQIIEQKSLPAFDFDKLFHFTLVYEVGKFTKMTTKLLTEDSKIFLTSKDHKEKGSNIHIFGSTENFSIKSMAFICSLGWNKKGNKFTLSIPHPKNERDDRIGELAGGSFKGNSKIPIVVIPRNQSPHFAISNRLKLSEIADTYQEAFTPHKHNQNDNDREIQLEDLPNQDKSQISTERQVERRFMRLIPTTFNESLQEELGSFFYVQSSRNTILIDEETKQIKFVMFRTSNKSFTVKVRHPLLPVQGHAIAISILKR